MPQRTQIAMALESIIARTAAPFTIVEAGSHEVTMQLAVDDLRVDMSVTSIRVEAPPADSVFDIAANAVVAAAVCLTNLGRPDTACAIVTALASAPVLANEQVAGRLAQAFGAAGRLREASDLALLYLTTDADREFFGNLLRVVIIGNADILSPGDSVHVTDNFYRLAAFHEVEWPENAGTAYYNLGNWLFHVVRDSAGALEAYLKAANLRPDYESQPYWLTETAAAYFENDEYEAAERMYQRVYDVEPRDVILARRADCLAYLGRRGEALALLRTYEAQSTDVRAVWRLKRLALESLDELRHLHVAPEHVEELADLVHPGLDATQLLATAFADNLLSAPLTTVLTICAFPAPHGDEPWPALLLLAHQSADDLLFQTALASAWHRSGESLVEYVLAMQGEPGFSDEDFLVALRAGVQEQRADSAEVLTLRMVDDAGNRSVLEMADDEAADEGSPRW